MIVSRYYASFMLVFLIGCVGCWPLITRNEVSRISSPDNNLDAVLFENNGGATTSFGYEIILAPKGRRTGTQVGKLYGAVRNGHAYGLNMKWSSNEEIVIEYLSTEQSPIIQKEVVFEGHHIRIVVHAGVTDPSAPGGGMLYNLRHK